MTPDGSAFHLTLRLVCLKSPYMVGATLEKPAKILSPYHLQLFEASVPILRLQTVSHDYVQAYKKFSHLSQRATLTVWQCAGTATRLLVILSSTITLTTRTFFSLPPEAASKYSSLSTKSVAQIDTDPTPSGSAFKFLPVLGKYVVQGFERTLPADLEKKWRFKMEYKDQENSFHGDGSRGGPVRREFTQQEKARL